MNKIKTLFATAILLVISLGTAQAQDINAAIEAYNNGATAAQEGNYPVALENLTRALELATALGEEGVSVVTDCKNLIPQLYFRQAKELAAAKNSAEALSVLEKATKTAQEYNDETGIVTEARDVASKIYNIMASDAFNAKDFAAALENYKKVLDFDPQNGAAYLRIGQASANLGKEDDALAAFEKAKEFGQEDNARKLLGSIFLKRAVSAQKSKDWAGTYEAAQKAADETDNVQAYKLIGLAAIELKKYPEALKAWEKVVADNPSAKDINNSFYRMAVVYEGLGDKASACTYYHKILNDPNFKSIAEYKIKTELKCE